MTRTVTKSLASMEDITQGVGSESQSRGVPALPVTVHKMDVPFASTSLAEIQALDVTKFTRARYYYDTTGFIPLIYDPVVATGMSSGAGAGSWFATKDHPVVSNASAQYSQVNGGVWQTGMTFTSISQYMIYAGVAYRPKVSTGLPYAVGAAPDTNFVTAIAIAAASAGAIAQNLAALKALDVSTVNSAYMECLLTPGDGGQNHFYYDSLSSATSDDVRVVTPNSGSGRWLAIVTNVATVVANVAAIKALNVLSFTSAYMMGLTVPGDGGQNHFRYDSASVAVADDILVIAPTVGPGRWLALQTDSHGIKNGSVTPGKLSFNPVVAINKYIYTANDTYIPAANTVMVEIEVFGPGGGGGGAIVSGIYATGGSAGGGGAYVYKKHTTPDPSYAIVVGVGGAEAAAGTASTVTSATLTLTANSGAGGNHGSSTTIDNFTAGAAGGSASGGDLNLPGGRSTTACAVNDTVSSISNSGSGFFGGSISTSFNGGASNGTNATAVSVGGSAGVTPNTGGGTRNGSTGGPGLVRITEYVRAA